MKPTLANTIVISAMLLELLQCDFWLNMFMVMFLD